jgi:hypothetical protein
MEIENRIDKIEIELKEHISKDSESAFNLGKIEEKQENYKNDFIRNWDQHKEFYDKINVLESENDRISGGLKLLNILLVPVIVSLIVSLVKSFMG